jgi:hypothetical protein
MKHIPPALALLICIGRCAVATITLPESGRQYASVPETAFKTLSFGVEYIARLQSSQNVLDDVYACNVDDTATNNLVVPSDSKPGTCVRIMELWMFMSFAIAGCGCYSYVK